MRIRHADPETHAAPCAAIYAPHVVHGVASLEEHAPDTAEIAQRMRTISASWPWLVAETDDGTVAGYAYASQHRTRAAYRWAVDVTVYVSPELHRSGVGRALYTPLFELLSRQGYYEACAGITLPNDASVGLHEALGFRPVGTYEDVAFKHGSWRTVGWWQKVLREREPGVAPAEPSPPPRLDT